MRIAFVSLMAGAQWGGSEVLWHSVAVKALSCGDKVLVSVYDWGKLHPKIEDLQAKGAVICRRERFDALASTWKRIVRFVKNRKPSLNRDYQDIIRFQPDMVFVSQGHSFDFVVHHLLLYKMLVSHHVPYSLVCHSHSQYSNIPSGDIYPASVDVFRNAKMVFFVSNRQFQLIRRRLASDLPNSALTWNPLNLQIPPQPLVWPQEDVVNMALVASISGDKGHDTAFEVLSGDEWKGRSWLLNIYGDGEGKKYLQDLASYLSISDKVVFHGHVQDILEVWQHNSILLIPSAGEGMPISLVEAMACGRPSVVTNVGGNTELVEENVTGFIAGSPNVHSFQVAMENAWRNKGNWKSMGFRAYDKINVVLDRQPEQKIYDALKKFGGKEYIGR